MREYIDRMTGSKDSRPSLNRLMADARVSLSDAIVGLIKMVIISFLLSLGLCVIARPSGVTKASLADSAKVSSKESQGRKLEWLDGYSGQTVEQLLSLEGNYRTDSLVLAFEQAIGQKAARTGDHGLTSEERAVLAVEALEREVNNAVANDAFRAGDRDAGLLV